MPRVQSLATRASFLLHLASSAAPNTSRAPSAVDARATLLFLKRGVGDACAAAGSRGIVRENGTRCATSRFPPKFRKSRTDHPIDRPPRWKTRRSFRSGMSFPALYISFRSSSNKTHPYRYAHPRRELSVFAGEDVAFSTRDHRIRVASQRVLGFRRISHCAFLASSKHVHASKKGSFTVKEPEE